MCYLSFWGWLSTFDMIVAGGIHFPTASPFVYGWKKKSIVYLCHVFFIRSFSEHLDGFQMFAVTARVVINGVLVPLCDACLKYSRLCLRRPRQVWWRRGVAPVLGEGHLKRDLWSAVAASLAKSVSSRFSRRPCLRKWGEVWLKKTAIATSGISNGCTREHVRAHRERWL